MTNELYHHGILGQKWGVRRFQNPDGSLTPEGRERYAKKALTVAKEARYGGGSIREASLYKNAVSSSQKKAMVESAKRVRSAEKKESDLVDSYMKNKQLVKETIAKFKKHPAWYNGDVPNGWPDTEEHGWYTDDFEFYMYTHPKFEKAHKAAVQELWNAQDQHRQFCLDFARDLLGQYAGKKIKTQDYYWSSVEKKPAEQALAQRLSILSYYDTFNKNGR